MWGRGRFLPQPLADEKVSHIVLSADHYHLMDPVFIRAPLGTKVIRFVATTSSDTLRIATN